MNIYELGMFFAYYIKSQANADVALLVRKDTRRPESWCREGAGGASRAATACVRVLQAQAEAGFAGTDYYLFTTKDPTAMCLGMCRRCHVTAVVFMENGKLRYKTWEDVSAPSRALTGAMEEMIAGLWAAEDPWKGMEAAIQKKGSPSILSAFAANNAPAMQAWVAALFSIPEVAFVWGTLPHSRELQPVAAPRFKRLPNPAAHGLQRNILRDKIYMTLAYALLDEARKGLNAQAQALQGLPICAVLIGPDGKLLSWGVNTNTRNITRHGETNCLQSYFQQANANVPDNSVLYTTLRSCEMCSGMLTTVARNLRVVYGSRDPGLGVTSLERGVNGCSEEKYAGPEGDPISAARFQMLAAKVMKQNYTAKVRSLVEERMSAYPAQVKLGPGLLPAQYKQASTQYSQAKATYKSQQEQSVQQLHPTITANMSTNRLPAAITTALTTSWPASNLSRYASLYIEMGAALMTMCKFQLREGFLTMSADDVALAAAYVMRTMGYARMATARDYDVWDEGYTLLRMVALSALAE
jgi:tRNA(Arg) A34 adenosine deaminase TadA